MPIHSGGVGTFSITRLRLMGPVVTGFFLYRAPVAYSEIEASPNCRAEQVRIS